MKKISIILFLGLFVLSGCSLKNNTKSNDYYNSTTNYNTSKTTTNNNFVFTPSPPSYTPTEISTFSTKIYDKSSGRQNNVQITISALNGTIVEPGEEFSFCEIVGKATPDKGYEKAKIFDKDGNVIEGYRWR